MLLFNLVAFGREGWTHRNNKAPLSSTLELVLSSHSQTPSKRKKTSQTHYSESLFYSKRLQIPSLIIPICFPALFRFSDSWRGGRKVGWMQLRGDLMD